MTINELMTLSDKVLLDVQNHLIEYQNNIGPFEKKALDDTKTTIEYLKKELINNTYKINERILRGMHDLGMYSYKVFENTNLEQPINKLTQELWDQIPEYRKLRPLDLDYVKGYPI